MDLLSNLDAARSACVRSDDCGDLKNPVPHLSVWNFAFTPARRFSFLQWNALSCSCGTVSPLVHLALVRDPGNARVSRAGFGGESLAEIFRDLDQEARKTGEDKEFLGIE